MEFLTWALFGRAPQAAPAGALPNGWKRSSSILEAAREAVLGFHLGGEATKTWLRAAPPPSSQLCPPGAGARLPQGHGLAGRRAAGPPEGAAWRRRRRAAAGDRPEEMRAAGVWRRRRRREPPPPSGGDEEAAGRRLRRPRAWRWRPWGGGNGGDGVHGAAAERASRGAPPPRSAASELHTRHRRPRPSSARHRGPRPNSTRAARGRGRAPRAAGAAVEPRAAEGCERPSAGGTGQGRAASTRPGCAASSARLGREPAARVRRGVGKKEGK